MISFNHVFDNRLNTRSRGITTHSVPVKEHNLLFCLTRSIAGLGSATLAVIFLVFFSSTGYAKITSSFIFTPPPHLVNTGKINNKLYKKGYLDVTLYDGWNVHVVDRKGVRDSTAALQKALDDAHDYKLTAYFPSGTYLVSNTLHFVKKYGGSLQHRYSTTLVGSIKGPRPTIKLKNNAIGFNNPNKIKPVLAVWRKRERVAFSKPGNTLGEPARNSEHRNAWLATGYLQRVQGIEIHCGKGNAGAVGLFFRAAQDSHIEDVRVVATGAFAGFYGIPSRTSAGAANIEVEGGRYGVYLPGDACSVIVGAVFRNQTAEAIHTKDFVPTTVVGFKVVKQRGPVVKVIKGGGDNKGALSLVDGTVELTGGGDAFDNTGGKNFYLRNVYIKGTNNIVKGSGGMLKGEGQWKRIAEYSSAQRGSNSRSYNLINGSVNKDEVKSIENNAPNPPYDLIKRHLWAKLPSFEDANVTNVADFGAKGNDTSDDTAAIQGAIDAAASGNGKVLIPKGLFFINKTLKLHANTQLFGVARHLTWIGTGKSWKPNRLTPMIQTVDDPDARTYLGHLTLQYESGKKGKDANDWFNPIHWRAGRNSMVVGVFTWAEGTGVSTQPRSEFHISGNGGGRWYFMGRHQKKANSHSNYRHVLIENTSQPLWWYGMNLEKPVNSDFNAEIRNASNIRIYGIKVEGRDCVMRIHDSTNVAVIGGGAMRKPPRPKNGAHYEISGASHDVLLANIIPQKKPAGDAGDHTVRDTSGIGIAYPGIVALFKIGRIDDAAMLHDGVKGGYGNPQNQPPSVGVDPGNDQSSDLPMTSDDGEFSDNNEAGITGNTSDSDDEVSDVESTNPSDNDTAFDTPSGFRAKAVSRTRIILKWKDVGGESGYVIRWKKAKKGRWNTIKADANVTRLSHAGLRRRTKYLYQIRAKHPSSDGKWSAWSAIISAKTR